MSIPNPIQFQHCRRCIRAWNRIARALEIDSAIADSAGLCGSGALFSTSGQVGTSRGHCESSWRAVPDAGDLISIALDKYVEFSGVGRIARGGRSAGRAEQEG